MKNRWSDTDANEMIARYGEQGVNQDVALRVYTSRLIGVEPELVIHGGGNTSVKTTVSDFLGDQKEVLCVKGSGWNLDTIEPEGLPAVHLAPLQKIRTFDALSDEDMVAFHRANLLNPSSPTPSVETLLHAFLPHKFVDHSHATAILAISDQPEGDALCREIFGGRLAYLPYVAPGFDLAKATAALYDQTPEVEGVLLHKHGLFTFGDTAKQSYDRMIEFVTAAEAFIDQTPAFAPTPISTRDSFASAAEIAPIIRGACSTDLGQGRYNHVVLAFRTSEAIRTYVNGRDVADYGTRGVVTPDHIIRTKRHPMVTPAPISGQLAAFETQVADAAKQFRAEYLAYFERNNKRLGGIKRMLDPSPCVVLVPGVGLFGVDSSRKAANIAADLAEITIDTVSKAERVGSFEALPEADLFDMEYWSLEQAKLGKAEPKPLAGQVVVITGGGGAIGAATAKLFAQNGAEVAVLDIDGAAAKMVAEAIGPGALALACDVTDRRAIDAAFESICERFGGLDILISNAGAAWQGEIGRIEDAVLRKSFELNFFAHQSLAQAAVAVLQRQKTGGALLFNASKQAVNPGADFGAYGLPKAATLFLSRQYALEYGQDGIRSNAVNADRIRSGLLTDEMIDARSKARGVSTDDYLAGNLLKQEVRAEDVAQAFLHHAVSARTTGDVTTVDGGNIAAALR